MNKKIWCLSAALFAGSVVFAAPADKEVKLVQKDAQAIDAAIKLFDSGDRAEAFALLKALENTNDIRILSRLGWCYYSGDGVERNGDSAYQYFKRSIDDPDGFGVYGMGACYFVGAGVAQDPAKAEELHKKALAMGNLYAAGNLAIYYANIGNNAEAIRHGEMCYNSQLPQYWRSFSAYMLGDLHDDPVQKISWWKKSAQLGYHEALLELAKLYNFGGLVEINMPQALEYAQMYTERTGDKVPYTAIAFDWAIEKMVLQDWELAKKYMLIAADNGEKRAYWYAFELTGNGKYALMAAESGDERGFGEAGVYLMNSRKDNPQAAEEYKQRAINYYKAAIELQDLNSLNAICNLAAAYAENENAENIEKSLELYQEAASWHFPRGLRGAGVMYLVFSESESNEEAKKKYALMALEHIASAMFLGDKVAADFMQNVSPLADKYSDTPEAQFFKGIKLVMQVPPDNADPKVIAEVEKLIKTAADAGCVQAMMVCGIDIAQTPEAAVQYLRKAATAGNLHAKWILGSSLQFDPMVSATERLNYLKELIAVGNKKSRNLYAQLLDEQGKTAEAIKEYRAAVATGHASSMTMLHLLLLRQDDENTMEEAWGLLSQAIEKHDGLAQCMAGLNCLDNPNFSPRFSMHLLMKGVIDQGGTLYFHLHHIAMNYARGIGVTKSAENAKRIAGIMLERGYTYGFYTMGQLYQTGAFGEADTVKAKEYYQKGAEQGVPECVEALKNCN